MDRLTRTETGSPDIADVTTRLHRFCRAVDALPAGAPAAGSGAAGPLVRVDDLLQRVRAVAALLNEPAARWDPVDHAAARVLLSDLTVVAVELRGMIAGIGQQFQDVAQGDRDVRRLVDLLAAEYADPLAPAAAATSEPKPDTQ